MAGERVVDFEEEAPTLGLPGLSPEPGELVRVYLLRFRLPSRYLVQKVVLEKTGGGYREVRDFAEKQRAYLASVLEGIRRMAYEKINQAFVYVESYGVWLAVSEESVEKAREVAGWLQGKLAALGLLREVKGGGVEGNYFVKVVEAYLKPEDARELLEEAADLLRSELEKLEEQIRGAEARVNRKALRRLERTLEYRANLLKTIKDYLARLG